MSEVERLQGEGRWDEALAVQTGTKAFLPRIEAALAELA